VDLGLAGDGEAGFLDDSLDAHGVEVGHEKAIHVHNHEHKGHLLLHVGLLAAQDRAQVHDGQPSHYLGYLGLSGQQLCDCLLEEAVPALHLVVVQRLEGLK
jgi:hypothetical protein